MSRFWQLFRPALARKAGQLNPQTLVGSLVARYGTSRSKSGKQFSLSAMTLRTQAASVCDNTCSVSTQQHRRSEHIVISQGNAVMFCQRIVLFRAKGNNCITHAAAAPSNLDLQRLSCKTHKNYSQRRRQLQLQNRILTPKRRKDDFEALFKRTFKKEITSAKNEKICWQITVTALMQPLQYSMSSLTILFVRNTEVLLPNFLW